MSLTERIELPMIILKKISPIVWSSIMAVLLCGCASPANRDAMVSQSIRGDKTFPYSVFVNTSGGQNTSAMDSSNISNEDLKAAIEKSILQANLFKSVVHTNDGDYELNVSVTSMSKPMFGLNFTVELETAWSLVKVSDRSIAMRKAVKSSHTATFSDAAAGVTRLRLAVEGAAQSNISQGLQAVADLNL